MSTEMYAYDVECFRNYFLAIFYDVEDYFKIRVTLNVSKLTGSEFEEAIRNTKRIVFHIGFGVNDIAQLVAFVNRKVILCSFNGLDYDNILLNACISNINNWRTTAYINENLYKLSKRIISNQDNNITDDKTVSIHRNMRTFYWSVDIQKVFGLNKTFKSLKQTLINAKWYNIEDYQMPTELTDEEVMLYEKWEIDSIKNGSYSQWDRYVMNHHLEGIFWYCGNDTLGVCEIMYQNKDEINLRFDISKDYGVNVLSSSRSNIADKLFGKFYCEEAGIDRFTYSKGRTVRTHINVINCIPDNVHFKSKELNDLLNTLKVTTIYDTKGGLNIPIKFNGIHYKIGAGGLHSADTPGKFESNEDEFLEDSDVSSYYPFNVINNKICPAHLNPDIFIKTTSGIVYRRIDAKHDKTGKRKTEAEALKIVINVGVFGKMGFDGPVQDAEAMVKVTVSGQLYLLMLIEDLNLAGFKVISANTDGIITVIPRNRHDEYLEICHAWEKKLKFELEFTRYEKYIRANVNHYMVVKEGDKPVRNRVKYKGTLNPLLYKEELTKGYNKPIVAMAINNYYLDDKPIMETIDECDDILDFCATFKPDKKFNIELHRIRNGVKDVRALTKDTRYYVSRNQFELETGVLLKNDTTVGEHEARKYTNIVAGRNVTVLNRKADFKDIREYLIDYGYYYKEASKIINQIESGSMNKRVIKKKYGQFNIDFE